MLIKFLNKPSKADWVAQEQYVCAVHVQHRSRESESDHSVQPVYQRIGSSKTARTSHPQQEQRVGKCAENVYDAN
jgi:hypothetical protein